jgi:hypothetical protein
MPVDLQKMLEDPLVDLLPRPASRLDWLQKHWPQRLD